MPDEDEECEERNLPDRLLIGPDKRGHWVVRDADGRLGGLFVSRSEALRFARSECEARLPAPTVLVAVDALELASLFAPTNDIERARRAA